MKTNKSIVLLFFCVSINFLYSHAQIIDDFKSFSDSLVTNQHYFFQDVEDGISQQILYLGEVSDERKEIFKVIVSITNLSGRGVNDLIFVSKENIFGYRMDLPSDLPFKVSYNEIHFMEDGVVKTMMLENNLNDFFCTPFECFSSW